MFGGLIHEETCSFPESFMPVSSLLHQILEKAELRALSWELFQDVDDLTKKRSDEHHPSREPLEMPKAEAWTNQAGWLLEVRRKGWCVRFVKTIISYLMWKRRIWQTRSSLGSWEKAKKKKKECGGDVSRYLSSVSKCIWSRCCHSCVCSHPSWIREVEIGM